MDLTGLHEVAHSLLHEDAGVCCDQVGLPSHMFPVAVLQRREVAPEHRGEAQFVSMIAPSLLLHPPSSLPDHKVSRVDHPPTAAVSQNPSVPHDGTRVQRLINERMLLREAFEKTSNIMCQRQKSDNGGK